MNRENNASNDEGKLPSRDITPVLKGWDYEPGTINVRKVVGNDGVPKLQMRLDLGLFQMEMNGRPDGVRPHGHESLLEFFERELNEHLSRNGNELGFQLTSDQCQSLREEAVMYYHRYLGLFVLEDFKGVVRDTARNLRVLDLCGKFASDEQDRLILEQYRPYLIMMHSRAKASIHFKQRNYHGALAAVQRGIADIKEFFVNIGQEEAFGHASEVRVLKKLARDIRRKLPVDPMVRLKQQLEKAVRLEHYEDAARFRDQIRQMSAGSANQATGQETGTGNAAGQAAENRAE